MSECQSHRPNRIHIVILAKQKPQGKPWESSLKHGIFHVFLHVFSIINQRFRVSPWRFGNPHHTALGASSLLQRRPGKGPGWWLALPPLWKKYEFVSWDDEFLKIWNIKKGSKPPTRRRDSKVLETANSEVGKYLLFLSAASTAWGRSLPLFQEVVEIRHPRHGKHDPNLMVWSSCAMSQELRYDPFPQFDTYLKHSKTKTMPLGGLLLNATPKFIYFH